MSVPIAVKPPRTSERPPWVRNVVLGLIAAVVLWFLAAAVMLWQARQSIESGIDRLEEARDLLSPGDLVQGEGRPVLEAAERDFARARDLAGSPILAPFGFVPLLGAQVRSIESQTAAAAEVVGVGLDAMAQADAVFATTPQAGPERVAMIQEVGGIATQAEDRLSGVDLGSDFFLVGPIGDARQEFSERLTDIRQSLADSRLAADGFAQFLQGPSRYLLLAANNAEMRAGSGMWLSAGVLTAENGMTTVGELVPTGDLVLPAGAVATPPELAELWGFMAPTRDLRNLAVTPRFEVTAPLAVDMWGAATGDVVDGVMMVDPLVLRALLAAEGGVDVPGVGLLDADNVLPYVFLEQYSASGDLDADQQARRDQLGSVARTTLSALDTRPWESAALADELGPAAAGRHVLAWSSDPTEQRGWEAAGVAGAVGPDALLVSLMNTSGTKLDQFLSVEGEIEHDGGRVTVELTIRNDAPVGAPAYVIGPHPRAGLAEGVYRGILAFTVPGASGGVRLDGAGPLVVDGSDGPTRVIGVEVQLGRGEAVTITLEFDPPADELVVEPSARVPPISWRVGDLEWTDNQSERVEW